MSILEWFANRKDTKRVTVSKLNIPNDIWVKCPNCSEAIYLKDLETNLKVCPQCEHHFRISSQERLDFIVDKNSFKEIDQKIKPKDFLKFKDTEPYDLRIQKSQKKTQLNEAIRIGEATINGHKVNIGVMDFAFMGGSMGSVVGEKVTRLFEAALKNHAPVIIFTASGGARMQEGTMSLMQLAKTSAAVKKLSDAKIPYISVLCDPTTGGTSASFAMLGDIHIAEPGALISFAGPRVIEQTIRQKLPDGFQRAEFLLEHGMVDMVVPRANMQKTLLFLIESFQCKESFHA